MPPLVVVALLSGCSERVEQRHASSSTRRERAGDGGRVAKDWEQWQAERAEWMRSAEQALPLQEKAATAEWRWSAGEVSLTKCASGYPRDGYDVQIIPNK